MFLCYAVCIGLGWHIPQLAADRRHAQWMNMHWSIPLLLSAFGPSCALVFGLPTLLSSQLTNSIGIQTDMSKLSIFA